MKFTKEFKEFIQRGSVVDMAVGIIIGGAFGKIVTSFVNDVLMPPIGILMGNKSFAEYKWVMIEAVGENPAVTLNWGAFIQNIVDFLIVAFAIFMMIKAMNKFKRKQEEKPAEPPKPSEEVTLLSEIRDLLKKQ